MYQRSLKMIVAKVGTITLYKILTTTRIIVTARMKKRKVSEDLDSGHSQNGQGSTTAFKRREIVCFSTSPMDPEVRIKRQFQYGKKKEKIHLPLPGARTLTC